VALYPNLDGPKALIERVLFGGEDDDTPTEVTITRNANGADDDTFNTTTGEWTPVGVTTVYSGKAAFSFGNLDRQFQSGGQVFLRAEARLTLPLDDIDPDDPPAVGDVVEVTANARDELQVGRKFRIERRFGGTFGITARYVMSEWVPRGRELPS
jgi:hypothetical protein